MELILFRHGKAELISDARDDHDRELTSPGRRKTILAAEGLANSLLAGRKIHIWSSPLRRAYETAEILAKTLNPKIKIEIVDAIAEGDWDELVRRWSQLKEIDVLIVVGHEPTLSHWSHMLCGTTIPFHPASAACLEITENTPDRSALLWFMRAGSMARLSHGKND